MHRWLNPNPSPHPNPYPYPEPQPLPISTCQRHQEAFPERASGSAAASWPRCARQRQPRPCKGRMLAQPPVSLGSKGAAKPLGPPV